MEKSLSRQAGDVVVNVRLKMELAEVALEAAEADPRLDVLPGKRKFGAFARLAFKDRVDLLKIGETSAQGLIDKYLALLGATTERGK